MAGDPGVVHPDGPRPLDLHQSPSAPGDQREEGGAARGGPDGAGGDVPQDVLLVRLRRAPQAGIHQRSQVRCGDRVGDATIDTTK